MDGEQIARDIGDRVRELIADAEEQAKQIVAAAEDLRFEYAARLRDEIRDLRRELREAREHGAPA